jgi:hypothetical protein
MEKYFFNFTRIVLLLPSLLLMQCADSELKLKSDSPLSMASIETVTSSTTDCSTCTYVVPPDSLVVDGSVLGLLPGSVIGLSASVSYTKILFKNIIGTEEHPIIIKNCDGTAVINGTGLGYSIKTMNSRHFRITGGDAYQTYGIKLNGGQMGVTLDILSTNFEVDHLDIGNSGFAGVMAKTDPTCDDATIRGNFVMKNVYLHDNYVHDSGGEGFYVGNSFYQEGMTTPCGVRLPHEIHYLKIYGNIVENAGWDGIQVGCATKTARIYGNTIKNYGTKNVGNQRNGMQLGAGTGGLCYGNLIYSGKGNGMIVMGLGDNYIYNNIIVDAGAFGIFCDERYTPGPGFKFINNTIISPKSDGIRIYADLVPMNVIVNNIIANPGSYSTYTYPRTPQDAFVYKLSKSVKIDMSNNFFTTSVDTLGIIDLAALNFKLAFTSPVIDQGRDISNYNIMTDFYKKTRLKGLGYDIGAVELQSPDF